MDVQGWEMEVLKGARELIGRRKIHFVYSEVGCRGADVDMQHFADMSDFPWRRVASGSAASMSPFRWGKNKEFLGFANALYM